MCCGLLRYECMDGRMGGLCSAKIVIRWTDGAIDIIFGVGLCMAYDM